jgi:hypothetical protein
MSGKRPASDDRPQVRPIGTLTEPAAEQNSVNVAHGAAADLSCISTAADFLSRCTANFENSYDLLNKWRYVNRGRTSAQVTEPRRFVVSRCDIDAESVSDREPEPPGRTPA